MRTAEGFNGSLGESAMMLDDRAEWHYHKRTNADRIMIVVSKRRTFADPAGCSGKRAVTRKKIDYSRVQLEVGRGGEE